MARARNIKPGFFQNEFLPRTEALGRLLFIGLWTLADREGRLEDRPMRIKAQLFPYEECDTDRYLNELQDLGFLIRYQAEGKQYIQIVNFDKHQNPHRNETPSIIPLPTMDESPRVMEERAHADSLIPDSLTTDSLIPSSAAEVVGTIPDGLNMAAWDEYVKYRRTAKLKKLQPISVTRQMKWLTEQGDERTQAEIIEKTIRNGYQGLCGLKANGSGNGNQRTKTRSEQFHDQLVAHAASGKA